MPQTNTYQRLLFRIKNRHLELLHYIGKHGTLTRAAREAGISQPAATRRLAEIEAILDAKLFVRTGSRLMPTLLGELALARAHRFLQELASWGKELETVQAGHEFVHELLYPERHGEVGIVDWRLNWSLPPIALIRRKREFSPWADERLAEVLRELCTNLGRSVPAPASRTSSARIPMV